MISASNRKFTQSLRPVNRSSRDVAFFCQISTPCRQVTGLMQCCLNFKKPGILGFSILFWEWISKFWRLSGQILIISGKTPKSPGSLPCSYPVCLRYLYGRTPRVSGVQNALRYMCTNICYIMYVSMLLYSCNILTYICIHTYDYIIYHIDIHKLCCRRSLPYFDLSLIF